ncbi:MAG: hypothetical protein ACF8K1_00945 [Phycisphaerales bacterium JB047]
MATTSSPYDIIKTQDICAQTGREIAVGEEHIAALIETPEEEALVRVAYTLDAWEKGPNLPPEASLFGFWKRILPEHNEQPKQLVSPDEMFDLFEQLADTTEERQITFRYLLALILMRKKTLVYERSTPPSGDEPGLLVLRQRVKGGEGPLFEVVDPGLDDEAITAASEEIGQVMNLDENNT